MFSDMTFRCGYRTLRVLSTVCLPRKFSHKFAVIRPYVFVHHLKPTANENEIFFRDLLFYPDFITEDEENSLCTEFEQNLARRRYEYDHWDNAIHGFRETERSKWNDKNEAIINRIRKTAFPPDADILPAIHIVDLAENGWIKPHVDSVRFCGNIIAGLSLLSDSVLRLTSEEDKNIKCDVLLKRRSLYIMKDEIRFKFAHEILKDEESVFNGVRVPRGRRVSLVARNEPEPS